MDGERADIGPCSLFTASGYGLLVFDYLLTLSDEIAYIWPSRWSLVKIIYLANRYGNLSMLGLMTWHIAGDLYSEAPSVRLFFSSPSSLSAYTMLVGI